MRVIFISGPYRSKDIYGIHKNIMHARAAAIRLWQQGNWAVICPHMNTAHFDGLIKDSDVLEGDLEILRRCDAIYMLNNYENSEGSKCELALAKELGLEIIYEPDQPAQERMV